MSRTDENKIAKEAFEILHKALPKGQFVLKSNYKDPNKIAILFLNNKKSVVLEWRSNSKDRELTTRKEYAKSLSKWFPGLKQETKPNFFSTILDDANVLLSAVQKGTSIVSEIIRIAASLD